MKQPKQHLDYINKIYNEVTEDSLKYHSPKEAFRYACKLIEIDARSCHRSINYNIKYWVGLTLFFGSIFVTVLSIILSMLFC